MQVEVSQPTNPSPEGHWGLLGTTGRLCESQPPAQQTGQGGWMSLCPCSGPAKDLITAFTKRGTHYEERLAQAAQGPVCYLGAEQPRGEAARSPKLWALRGAAMHTVPMRAQTCPEPPSTRHRWDIPALPAREAHLKYVRSSSLVVFWKDIQAKECTQARPEGQN